MGRGGESEQKKKGGGDHSEADKAKFGDRRAQAQARGFFFLLEILNSFWHPLC